MHKKEMETKKEFYRCLSTAILCRKKMYNKTATEPETLTCLI